MKQNNNTHNFNTFEKSVNSVSLLINNLHKVTLILLLAIGFTMNSQNEWDDVPIPAEAGPGRVWVLQESPSDDFEYNFAPNASKTFFGLRDEVDSSITPTGRDTAADLVEKRAKKWENFYHNRWDGPGATAWKRDQVSVADGNLVIKASRKASDGNKSFAYGGTTISRPTTRAGCITSTKRVMYPVFIESRVKVMNSSLASDIWLLSADDTQEIDIIEAYGGAMSDNRNSFFAERIHLSHHVFERSGPILDYQPADWNSWFTRTGVKSWGGVWVNIGVYWKDETTIEYYVDGVLERTLKNDAIKSRIPNGTWEYTYPAGIADGKILRNGTGSRQNYQKVVTAPDFETAQKLSKTSVIDPINYLKNGGKFTKELDIIINVEDQSWQAADWRSPNNTEIQNEEDNTLLVDWIRVYKPLDDGTGASNTDRNLVFTNRDVYIPSGKTTPEATIGSEFLVDLTYNTGISDGVEEDLSTIKTQIVQVDNTGVEIKASTPVIAVTDDSGNTGTITSSYLIPINFSDGSSIVETADLPTGHKYILKIIMSVDGETAFSNANDDILLLGSTAVSNRARSVVFNNRASLIPSGKTLPEVAFEQTIPLDISYATGISASVEEDLNYIAVQVRQLNETNNIVGTSAFVTIVSGAANNTGNVNYNYTIPTNFSTGPDGVSSFTELIPTTEDLPAGHKLILLIFMEASDGSSNVYADANGEIIIKSSGTLSINDFNTVKNKITLYPNPTQELLKLTGIVDAWEIYTMLGVKIKQGNTNEINVLDLSSGLYYISIKSIKGAKFSKSIFKFVKS